MRVIGPFDRIVTALADKGAAHARQRKGLARVTGRVLDLAEPHHGDSQASTALIEGRWVMWWLRWCRFWTALGTLCQISTHFWPRVEEPSRRRGFQHQRAARRQPVVEARDHAQLFGVVVEDTRAPDQIERDGIGQNIVIHDVAVTDVDLVENATTGQIGLQKLLGVGQFGLTMRSGPSVRSRSLSTPSRGPISRIEEGVLPPR